MRGEKFPLMVYFRHLEPRKVYDVDVRFMLWMLFFYVGNSSSKQNGLPMGLQEHGSGEDTTRLCQAGWRDSRI